MARIRAPFFRATATAPLFFTLAPPRRAPPFLVRASGAVALKVAQVPSTGISIRVKFEGYSEVSTVGSGIEGGGGVSTVG